MPFGPAKTLSVPVTPVPPVGVPLGSRTGGQFVAHPPVQPILVAESPLRM